MTNPGLITINKLSQEAFIGWTAEERAFPSILVLDIALETSFERAFSSDELGDTVDYMAVVETVRSECKRSSWRLIEKMGADLAKAILAAYPAVRDVKIRVTKNVSPLCESVSIETSVRRG